MSGPWSQQNPGEQPPAYGQQPGWGQAPGPGQQPGYGQPTSGKATTVLVLGIASLVLMVFCGLGFIMGDPGAHGGGADPGDRPGGPLVRGLVIAHTPGAVGTR